MGCATLSGDERWCDGREHGEHKAIKERCRYEARSAYLFPTSLPARIEIAVPLGLEVPALLNTPHPLEA
jgi:hypothetical protein